MTPLKKWQYKFTLRTQKLREARGLSNICYRCGVLVKIGENTYSRNSGTSKSRSKLYHKACAEAVNII